MNSTSPEKVVIIGGGVIGAMCGWYLQNSGHRVTIVDRAQFGRACSHGNCGYVAPSHILPLPQPGAIRKTMAAMLKPNSPFAIKPRFSSSFVSWFWNFSRRCNRKDMMNAATGRHQILQSSKQLYEALIETGEIDCEWQANGLLFVFDTKRDFEHFAETNDLLRKHFGVEATPHAGDQLNVLEPAIKPGWGGGWHFEGDCHVRPDKLMSSLRQSLIEAGVELIENAEVKSFEGGNEAKAAVLANGEHIEGDAFVVATGAWTPFLNQALGCKIPIEPGKGYSLTMPCPKQMPRIPIIFEDSHVAITPMETKYRIGSTMEFVGYDTSINPRRLALLKSAAEKYLHDPYCDPIEEEWFGWRPMTWDGKPVIDRCPAFENIWIAAGHNMLGLSMATGTGKLICELIDGEQPHLDVEHFSLKRFRS